MKTRIENPMILKIFAAMFITVSVFTACTKSNNTTTGPGTNEVFIQSYAFTPSTITVSVNTTITWTNKDGVAHTVTSTSGLFDSGSLSNGVTYSHTFATAGTFSYKCTFHAYMTGTVIVQ
jgi:plastocyanin